MKAVIPAAGMGTRFLPATKAQPKEMLPIIDKPAIQFVVEEAVASGIDDILIITGRGKRAIEDHFDKSYELEDILRKKGKIEDLKKVKDISNLVDIHYIRQKEQRGLGDAILCAKKHVNDEVFAVLLGDDIIHSKIPVTKQMINLHEKYHTSVVAVEKVARDRISRYGVINGSRKENSVYEVQDLVEKPSPEKAPSNLGIVGRYLLTPEIFDILGNTKLGVGNELQLTDGLKELLKTQTIHACEFEGRRYDIGTKLDYVRATIEFSLKRKDMHAEIIKHMKKQISCLV